MTPQELKSSILQLAVQGKLVPQIPEEGTGEELYQQIQAEKQKLTKEGTIRNEKPLPEITEDEFPFDIPKNWKWAYFSDLFDIGSAIRIHQSDWKTEGIPFFRGRELVRLAKTGNPEAEIFITQELYEKNRAKGGVPQKGDLLVTAVGTLGKVYIVQGTHPFYYKDAYILRYNNYGNLYSPYFKYVIESPFIQEYIAQGSMGTTVAQLTIQKAKRMICPLPPLSEQKRIVAKIEELLPYIDRYEKAWSRMEDFNKRFPVDMQKSILQMAIQGKLVEQRPEEGTGEELYQQIQAEKQKLIKEGKIKKEKPLPEITEEEIPFEIPESWKWCRLNSLGVTQTGNTPSKAHPEYIGTDIPFITPGDILNGQIYYDNQALSLLGKKVARVSCVGSIMQVCIGGSIGKAAIAYREVTFNQQINVISPIACLSEYVFAVMQSEYFITTMKDQAGGTATPIINRGLWDSLLIPLPPLAEQKRIVAKLEEILPLCERLK